jgi:hypothetical protein
MAEESNAPLAIDTEADITAEFLSAALKQPVNAVEVSSGSDNIHLGRVGIVIRPRAALCASC